ncbi:exodeoxyribonuclease VII small subunit [Sporolituus thermophilus]|uniref:Exodeoxyribonuclease 7 small subunit n=1 Tax=Sporolituus thermophilus DSM 23256 TaxID=1123285 RepID=A0A1G7IAT6_9FIRM|nr:exodeoxyribonuclease VII small subunit [Sporolituus thermophilus]SDF09857.1 Exodeoxyribonuclease VII small subunit [Sporolituus thermophilus DSM 23256]
MEGKIKGSIDQENVCFEEALGKLELIVKRLEKGDLPLEEMLEQFAEGVTLSQVCLQKLSAAEERIYTILQEEQGKIKQNPLLPGEEGKCKC